MIKKSKFYDRKKHQAMNDLYEELAVTIGAVLTLPFVKGATQSEEFIRKYALAARTKDHSRLPYVSGGVGARERNKMRCLGAEFSQLITSIWRYDDNQIDPIMEEIRDLFEYLYQLIRDPDTIRVETMPLCRYRLVNNLILNGNKMDENKTDTELKALADRYTHSDDGGVADDIK